MVVEVSMRNDFEAVGTGVGDGPWWNDEFGLWVDGHFPAILWKALLF